MPLFHVTVRDVRVASYAVEASSAEEAKELIEYSDDANAEFSHNLVDSSWEVESVISHEDQLARENQRPD